MTASAVRNPISGIEWAFPSLNAAAATGAGTQVDFSRPRQYISMQVSFTSNPSPVKVTLEGTIDGVNWFTLATFDTGASGRTGDIIDSNTLSVLSARANLITLTGGTTPTVTATILAT